MLTTQTELSEFDKVKWLLKNPVGLEGNEFHFILNMYNLKMGGKNFSDVQIKNINRCYEKARLKL